MAIHLALIYLVKPKINVVVPENFIFGSDDENQKLKGKNSGVNNNQKYITYWKNEWWTNENNQPNFEANLSEIFPPPVDSCYECRIKQYFLSHEQAIEHAVRFRAVLPALYNVSRLYEAPIPLTELRGNAVNVNLSGLSNISLDNSIDTNTITLPADTANATQNSSESNTAAVLQGNKVNVNPSGSNENSLDNSNGTNANTLPIDTANATQNSQESNIVSSSFDYTNITHMGAVDEPLIDETIEPIDANTDPLVDIKVNYNIDINADDVQAFGSVFQEIVQFENIDGDDDVQIEIIAREKMPKPVVTQIEVKVNDVLTGTIPFIQNANGDRVYSYTHMNTTNQIAMSSFIYKSLLNCNSDVNRNSFEYDKKFIKGLLITCFGMSAIEKDEYEPALINFIREIYLRRAGDDHKRRGNFSGILWTCYEDLKKQQFR